MKFISRSACLVLFFAILTGCASRNLYRNARFEKPPLEQAYTHMSREQTIEAGAEPVESGEVALTDKFVIVASESKGLEAFDRTFYRKKWSFKVKNGVLSRLLLENNTLYFGAEDGSFYSVDANTGKLNWKYVTKAPVYTGASIYEGKIFLPASDDVVYCLDKATGKWIWHYRRSGSYITTIRGNSTPAVANGHVYIGFSDGYLVSLKANDGNLEWETKIHSGSKFTDVDAMPVLDGKKIYIPSYDGGLYVLDQNGGKILWKVDIGGSRKLTIDGDVVYLPSSTGFVYALNKESGKILWKFELDHGVPTSLVMKGDYIAFGSSQQYFYAIRKTDGTLAYRFNSGMRSGFLANPVMSEDHVYAMSAYGTLYSFRWKLNYHPTYYGYQ